MLAESNLRNCVIRLTTENECIFLVVIEINLLLLLNIVGILELEWFIHALNGIVILQLVQVLVFLLRWLDILIDSRQVRLFIGLVSELKNLILTGRDIPDARIDGDLLIVLINELGGISRFLLKEGVSVDLVIVLYLLHSLVLAL